MTRTKKRMSDAWTILFVVGGFIAIALAIGFYMARLQDAPLELQQANPGWKVQGRYGTLRLDDATPAGEVYVSSDDAEPYRIERVDCAEVKQVFPGWFHLPDVPLGNCVKLGNAAPYTLVLNLRTATKIPELWDELYQPTVERLGLSANGSWLNGDNVQVGSENLMETSGEKVYAPAPGGANSGRLARSLHYTIEPHVPGVDRKIVIDAFYYGDMTLAVFTFRPEPRP